MINIRIRDKFSLVKKSREMKLHKIEGRKKEVSCGKSRKLERRRNVFLEF